MEMLIFAFIVGLMFGSFANVVIVRLPGKKSVIKPPSACPACGIRLAPWDLIPVVSWVFLMGKCRRCRAKISLRYPLVELVCGVVFVGMMHLSPTLSVAPLWALGFVLVTVAFIDWDTREIPDGLLICAAFAGALWVALGHLSPGWFPLAPVWYHGLLGMAAGALPLLVIDRLALLIWKKDGFGYGDVKLMAVIGLFLGWQMTLLSLVLSVLICFPFAVYLLVKQQVKQDGDFNGYMAFGPFLCLGALLALWFGECFFAILL